MNLKFWKKKAHAAEDAGNPQEAPDDKTVAMEVPALDVPAKAGLATRVKSGLSGLLRRFRKMPAPEQENGEEGQPSNAPDSTETAAGNNPALRSIRMKKRMVIGGAIGLLVLLLAGAGFAAWKIFLSPPQHEAAEPAQPDAHHDGAAPEHAAAKKAETPQDEIEALKKKNEALQAQIEAMKKEQPQDQPPPSPDGSAEENAAAPSSTGEMTISNKDPKAAAQTLKEAIEAMNAGAGGTARKPAK